MSIKSFIVGLASALAALFAVSSCDFLNTNSIDTRIYWQATGKYTSWGNRAFESGLMNANRVSKSISEYCVGKGYEMDDDECGFLLRAQSSRKKAESICDDLLNVAKSAIKAEGLTEVEYNQDDGTITFFIIFGTENYEYKHISFKKLEQSPKQ